MPHTLLIGFLICARGDSQVLTPARLGRFAFLCACLLMCRLVTAEAGFAAENGSAPQKLHVAGLEVAAWIPSHYTADPWPIIIFSHGFHGCNTQSIFLMERLAGAGYAVFAPNHRDAACGNIGAWFTRPEDPFRDPRKWTDTTFADRAEDKGF
jgi:predicted dienelactone hydrolase